MQATRRDVLKLLAGAGLVAAGLPIAISRTDRILDDVTANRHGGLRESIAAERVPPPWECFQRLKLPAMLEPGRQYWIVLPTVGLAQGFSAPDHAIGLTGVSFRGLRGAQPMAFDVYAEPCALDLEQLEHARSLVWRALA
jgi:hypothetical protein